MVSQTNACVDKISLTKDPSATTNLTTRNGLDPDKHKIHGNHHYANDPEHLRIVGTVVSEDDGVNNTTEVTYCADDTGEDTLMRVSIDQETAEKGDLPLA
jgi:hypothetical protein